MDLTNILSLEEKVGMLNKCAVGAPLDAVSVEVGVDDSAVMDAVNNHEKITALVNSSYFKMSLEMASMAGSFPQMERILFAWYTEQVGKEPITSKMLSAKAVEILSVTGENGFGSPGVHFKATKIWASAFRKRYGISSGQRGYNGQVEVTSTLPSGSNTVNMDHLQLGRAKAVKRVSFYLRKLSGSL